MQKSPTIRPPLIPYFFVLIVSFLIIALNAHKNLKIHNDSGNQPDEAIVLMARFKKELGK